MGFENHVVDLADLFERLHSSFCCLICCSHHSTIEFSFNSISKLLFIHQPTRVNLDQIAMARSPHVIAFGVEEILRNGVSWQILTRN
jgi:hypothetical protein